jgi:hypothetical protein
VFFEEKEIKNFNKFYSNFIVNFINLPIEKQNITLQNCQNFTCYFYDIYYFLIISVKFGIKI